MVSDYLCRVNCISLRTLWTLYDFKSHGLTLFERAKQERSSEALRRGFLEQAATRFEQTLLLDSENLTAHYNLALIGSELGDREMAAAHRRLHEKYRPDDNARDRAISIARRANPAADQAAQAIVIYDLQRPGKVAAAR